MKKLLLSLAVGTALMVPQMPAAQAACIDETTIPPVNQADCVDAVDGPYIGGCSFVAATDAVAGEGQMTGEIDVEAVVYPTVALQATFRCYIKVNGATQPGAIVSASGTVVVVGGGVITYTSSDVADFVQLCQDVDLNSDDSYEESQCFEADTFEIPPPIVWEIVDPPVCQVLASKAGAYEQGGHRVYINPHGDVWVDGEGQYDCPVYGNVFGQQENDN